MNICKVLIYKLFHVVFLVYVTCQYIYDFSQLYVLREMPVIINNTN